MDESLATIQLQISKISQDVDILSRNEEVRLAKEINIMERRLKEKKRILCDLTLARLRLSTITL